MVDLEGFCQGVVRILKPQIEQYGMTLEEMHLKPLPPQDGVKDELFLLNGVVTAEFLPKAKGFAATIDKKYLVVANRGTAEALGQDLADQFVALALREKGYIQ